MQVRRAEVVELVAPRTQQCVGNGQIWQDKKRVQGWWEKHRG